MDITDTNKINTLEDQLLNEKVKGAKLCTRYKKLLKFYKTYNAKTNKIKQKSVLKKLISELLNNVSDGIVILNNNFNVLALSDKAKRIFESVIFDKKKRAPFVSFLSIAEAEKVLASLEKLKADGFADSIEVSLSEKSGVRSLSQFNFKAISHKNSKLFIVIIKGLASLETKESFSPSEQRFRLTAELTEQIVYDWDIENGVINWAGAIEQLLGYDYFQYRKMNIFEWERIIHYDDRERVISIINKAANEGGKFKIEYKLLRIDMNVVFVEDNGMVLLDENKTAIRVIGSIKDITEKKKLDDAIKESEALYRSLIETTNTGYVVTDSTATVIDCNLEYAQLAGFNSINDVIGKKIFDWTAPYDLQKNYKAFGDCLRIGFMRNLELDYIHPNGKSVSIEINATIVQNKESNKVIAICRNIESRKSIEKSREKYAARLKKLREIEYAILKESTITDISKTAARYLRSLIDCKQVFIVLINRDEKLLEFVAVDSEESSIISTNYKSKYEDYAYLTAISKGNFFYINNLEEEKDNNEVFMTLYNEGIRSIAFIPLISGNRMLGFISMSDNKYDAFNSEQLDIAYEVGLPLSISLLHFIMQDTIKKQSLRLEKIRQIELAMLLKDNPREMVLAALVEIRKIIYCQRASLIKHYPETNTAKIIAVDIDSSTSMPENTEFNLEWLPNLEDYKLGQYKLYNDLSEHRNIKVLDMLYQEGMLSHLSVPLLINNELTGILNFSSEKINGFNDEHVNLITEMAMTFALLIKHADLRSDLESYATEIEQKLNERAILMKELEEQNQKLDLAMFSIDNSAGEIQWLTPDGSIIYANKASCNALGYTLDELYKLKILDIDPSIDMEKFNQLVDILRIKKKNIFETFHKTKAGKIFPIEVTSNLFIYNGKEYIFSFSQDISERKAIEESIRKSEETARIILNATTDALILLDVEGNILNFNDVYAKRMNKTNEELIERNIFDFPDYDNLKKQKNELKEYLINNRTSYNTEVYRRNRWYEERIYPVFDYNDKIIHLVVFSRDITDRKEAEDTIQKQIKELEAKNSELERFTYTVSHDLRSPLITIKGFAGALSNDFLKGKFDRANDDIQRIVSAAEKMQDLLQDLLELSRIGRLINPPTTIKVNSLIDEVCELLHGSIAQRGIEISVQKNIPDIFGDRQRIKEVFQNLIENSIKFIGEQKNPKIEIGYYYNNNDELVYYVKDNGIGIDKKYHDNIFGLFNKLDQKSEGTGIGLSLVKRIIEFHNGRIWLDSEPEKGSTFNFSLKKPINNNVN
jgi:PAS domain S-box-containing protein